MARKRPKPSEDDASPLFWKLLWLLATGAWLLLAAAMVSYDPADWPSHMVALHNDPARNWAGIIGAVVAHRVYLMLGPGVWVILSGGAAGLGTLALRRRVTQPVLRGIGLIIMAVAASALIGLSAPRGLPFVSIDGGRPEGTGGLLALLINDQLTQRFNVPGTTVILLVSFFVGALLAVDELFMAVPRIARRLFELPGGIQLPRLHLSGLWPRLALLVRHGTMAAPLEAPAQSGKNRKRQQVEEAELEEEGEYEDEEEDDEENDKEDEDEQVTDETEALQEDEFVDPDRPVTPAARAPAADEIDEDEDEEDEAAAEKAQAAEQGTVGQNKAGAPSLGEQDLRAKIKKLPINFAATTKKQAQGSATGGGIGREVDLSGYRFPELTLLEDVEDNFSQEHERIVREQAVALESALQEYRIEGEVVGIDSGPVITLYEVRLAPGTKVARINAIASDISRALKSHNIRIVPNMVGKDTVGVEVPNSRKQKVRIKELMTANPELPHSMKLPMWLGKDASGNPLVADLTDMPHMLIAGTTGSGKSVCINTIITSFLFTKRPDELKLVLVDPKMVELSMFKDIPHLMCPVVTEMPKAAAILEWATTKMDERYELLAEAGVRDVAGYNELGWDQLKERFEPKSEAEEARIPKKLPYIVFIIDELADLMMTAKETEGFIVRLAQKARAVGIHLILATQRPQANVVTGLIKGNMPCRISFKVASGLDSRIVLDQKGAELLLGQGDMLYLSPRSSKLKRSQGALVEDSEIRRTVRFLKQVAGPSFEPQLVQIKSTDLTENDGERDPLFDDAVRVVLESRRGSVSLLQRRLTIGYSRSSRLIEQMSEVGILGDYKGSQAREVTMTLDDYEKLLEHAQAEAAAVAVHAMSQESQDVVEPQAHAATEEALKDTVQDPVEQEQEEELEEEDEAQADEVDGAAESGQVETEQEVEDDEEVDEDDEEESQEGEEGEAKEGEEEEKEDDEEEDGEYEYEYEEGSTEQEGEEDEDKREDEDQDVDEGKDGKN